MITVVKIGGHVLDAPHRLQAFLNAFAELVGPKILVHGGGKMATAIGARLGIESKYVAGRRITDEATLELVTMVYAGLLNKRLTASLQSLGCNALGITGADGNSIRATRRAVAEIDFGYVGDVHERGIHVSFLRDLLQRGMVPVIAPLTHDGQGGLLNTNADSITKVVAAALAQVMPTRIIYCFEKAGVLLDPKQDTTVMPHIHASGFRELMAAGAIADGMIPKLNNAFAALDAGVRTVVIGQAEALSQLVAGTKGTQIL
ncbi:MAG: acetylglutamate kinase [Bacteroidetes bacterium]|nr:acetylglutamate kinase [Bacteroidota bacterium]MBS1628589.1 acetylglutamate kinase [Bacteroidota bacterium]